MSGRQYPRGGKRDRPVEPPKSSALLLLESLIQAGDGTFPALDASAEGELESLARAVKREARLDADATADAVLDCAVHLPAKIPLYSVLIGLLNVEEPDLALRIVHRAADGAARLGRGIPDARPRLLFRLLASLVATNVVEAGAVAEAAVRLVKGVVDAQAETQAAPIWTLRYDALVHAVLAAIPFGGDDLVVPARETLTELVALLDEFLERRSDFSIPGLRPFLAPVKEDDRLFGCDFGVAHHAGELVQAFREFVSGDQFQLPSIPRTHAAYQRELGNGTPHKLKIDLSVEKLDFGDAPEAQVGARVLSSFPPRGILPLLDRQHTVGDRPALDKIICEDYVLDTVRGFESNRAECARRLTKGLPIPHPYEPLLCEVLFSQMMRVPRPTYRPILYGTLMVELCKLLRLFPRAMSTCVRECFARLRVMDLDLRVRLAEWLAYHLSNFEFVWPWTKWARVLTAPPHDAQRQFCSLVMDRLVRLSYWDRVQSVVPAEFHELLPPKPDVSSAPVLREVDPAQEEHWTAELVQMIRSKASPEALEDYLRSQDVGAHAAPLLLKAILTTGFKTYTHMVVLLERYYGPLAVFMQDAGPEGELALLETMETVWRDSTQRASMVVDRLLTLRLVSVVSTVTWALSNAELWNVSDVFRSMLAWEALRSALDKSVVRVQDAEEDVRASEAAPPPEDENAAAELEEKKSYLAECRQQETDTVLCVARRFSDALGPDWVDLEDAFSSSDDVAGVQREVQQLSLVSYVRSYFEQVTAHADIFANELSEGLLAGIRPFYVY